MKVELTLSLAELREAITKYLSENLDIDLGSSLIEFALGDNKDSAMGLHIVTQKKKTNV